MKNCKTIAQLFEENVLLTNELKEKNIELEKAYEKILNLEENNKALEKEINNQVFRRSNEQDRELER